MNQLNCFLIFLFHFGRGKKFDKKKKKEKQQQKVRKEIEMKESPVKKRGQSQLRSTRFLSFELVISSPPSDCIVASASCRCYSVIDAVPKILRQWILFSNNIVILWARQEKVRDGGDSKRYREGSFAFVSRFYRSLSWPCLHDSHFGIIVIIIIIHRHESYYFSFFFAFFFVDVAVVEGGGYCIETNGTKTTNHFDVIFRLAKSNHTIEPFVAICRASISTDPNVKPHSQPVGLITIYPSYPI